MVLAGGGCLPDRVLIKSKPAQTKEAKKKVMPVPTKVVLSDPGKEKFVDYTKYGEFTGVGTKDYKYVVKDQEGLKLPQWEKGYILILLLSGGIRSYKKAIKRSGLEG